MNNKFFIFLSATLVVLYAYSSMGKGLITSEMARRVIRTGEIGTVVDVRTLTEWKLGHYRGARHIPSGSLTPGKFVYTPHNTGILVYCNTGQRARAAAEKIRGFGFTNVYYIKGGYWTLLKS